MSLYRTLTEKPWQRLSDADFAASLHTMPPQRVALRFFLAVVTIMFGLFLVAYVIRMELDDWRPMPETPQLWVNTGILFFSSMVLQWTRNRLDAGDPAKVRLGLLLGGIVTLVFVLSQLNVWQDMYAAGYVLYNNPANSFFYVLTGIHALHLLGGLFVWTRASFRVWFGGTLEEVRLGVELCTVYWHFLLLVWLVLFAVLSYT